MNRAFLPADILLPAFPAYASADWQRWAVIACDQFTSQPEYWEKAADIAGGSPSALNLILPEAYLEDDADGRIARIQDSMRRYLADGIFREYKDSFVYTERMTSDGLRCGIVGMIDLEEYDYTPESTAAVRATEETVASRIPPRVRIRRGAPLELPHIMILINDPGKTVTEPLAAKKAGMKKLYDTELMLGGGRIEGYLAEGDIKEDILSALDKLAEKSAFVYAMGDGNHSLATAKAYYEELKKNSPGEDLSGHPARYALAEIVNLHSDAIRFEGIHRIVTGIDTEKFLEDMTDALGLSATAEDCGTIDIILGTGEAEYAVKRPSSPLEVGSVQMFIDGYLKENGGSVDYIHGADTVRELVKKNEGSVGILLPDMKKEELFPAVEKGGSLPRKTFSMGHAEDKRYYIEARKI